MTTTKLMVLAASPELMSNATGEALLRLRNEDPAAPAE